ELAGAPYVDVDPASLVGAGLSDELIRQRDLGRRTLGAVLDRPEDGTWPGADTWVLDRGVDAATVAELTRLGVAHLVLPSDTVVAGPGRLALPGSLATDALTLATEDLASGSPVDPILAANQLLGRLAATATLNPSGTAVALRIDPETVDPTQL